MSEQNRTNQAPPPAPPLPRPGVLQRLVAPLGFGSTARPSTSAQTRTHSYTGPPRDVPYIHGYAPLPSQTTAHKTRIPIAALDINGDRTHAVLAGKEILKTIRIEDRRITEEVNLRSKINQYLSPRTISEDVASRRRDFLPATDVKWSHGQFENYIATAAVNGRIALYDVSRSEVERAWLHEHTGTVHRLAFDPHIGALLLSGSHDGTVRMWDLRHPPKASLSTKSAKRFQGRVAVRDVKWCPTSQTDAIEFVLCTDAGVIQKWDLRSTSVPILTVNAHDGKPCLSIDWHPDGKHVVSGGLDKRIRVWDFQSDNRKQKPAFDIKAPQAIRIVKWRPAGWSAELAGNGQWQCTQLAASYNQDDPRIHIWDLRRPLLPFRELERYKTPARDLLWATKDLMWTVGDEGMFTQTDVSFAPQVHTSLSPGCVDWFPAGEYAIFAEDIGIRRGSGMEDPAVGFLGVTHEKLSSGEEGAISNSLSDEEVGMDGLLPNTFKKRQSKAASSKSGKSQTNTPPSAHGFPAVLSLEKAVGEKDGAFNNKQVGMIGRTAGLTAEADIVSFLAHNYAQPSLESERKAQPDLILERLQATFVTNSKACDEVSMHRAAQSWRILGAVIIPELARWADKNRVERLERVEQKKKVKHWEEENRRKNRVQGNVVSPSPVSVKEQSQQDLQKQEKVLKSPLRSLAISERHHLMQEVDSSTSNMTTPMARPLPDSPISDINSPSPSRFQNLDDTLERLPQLPPSVLISHSTAAVASKALLDTPGSILGTQLSHPPNNERPSRQSANELVQPMKPLPLTSPQQTHDPVTQKSKLPQTQRPEDRRAVLRDYRVQARPVLTFDEPSSSEDPAGIPTQAFTSRHDSTDSFPMFSASTESSHKGRSIGESFESPERKIRNSEATDGWSDTRGSGDLHPSSPPLNGSDEHQNLTRRYKSSRRDQDVYNETQGFGMDGSGDLNFGLDGQSKSKGSASTDEGPKLKAWADWDEEKNAKFEPQVSLSSSPDEPFHFEPVREPPRANVHTVNPMLRSRDEGNEEQAEEVQSPSLEDDLELSDSPELVYNDFRPIDITEYNPNLPFAWSAYEIISQAIAYDLKKAPACGQFSVHLLMHVHPYFFHQVYRNKSPKPVEKSVDIAERIMHPSLNARVFEGIFLEHHTYLQRLRLFVPMAEMRKMCAEFEYPRVHKQSQQAEEAGLVSANPHSLAIACAQCQAPMQNGKAVCQRCGKVRNVCPICLSFQYSSGIEMGPMLDDATKGIVGGDQKQALWMFCHGCSHSAHFGCMAEWLAHPYSEGECATAGCGHDCGPGKIRDERIARQASEIEAKPSASALKKDSFKVSASAAVERTRKTLRGMGGEFDKERGTQSGDDRSFTGRIGRSGRGSFSGVHGQGQGQSQRKSVRLITPGEEISQGGTMTKRREV